MYGLTLILHDPPMLIPPIPPAAAPVDDGIAIPVPLGVIPVMAITADVIMLWSILTLGSVSQVVGSWC
jgi:hypothetical protein